MKRSQWKARQDYWVDTEKESRPEGKTWWHIVILESYFLLFDWLLFGEGEGCSFEIGRSRGWKNFGQGGWGVLKIWQFSWTSYVYRPNDPVHKIFRKINISYPLIRPSTFSFLNFVFCERLRSISSSRSQMFFKISHALKNFAIFTGKHLCWSIFLIN